MITGKIRILQLGSKLESTYKKAVSRFKLRRGSFRTQVTGNLTVGAVAPVGRDRRGSPR